ncbi:GNAT family N-acetyltransferase [Flavobacterium sp.]|uniref:GNAT family N-acetyltransferase n=1 Tax=Flavobacterium sp. TaxID=239 RepID=UPI002615EA8A|nr:GNAT family N-acetyltransferase [Flavobacterium sp.]MDG2431664.1 GNAT family N-acetyltransferase [Flavobacterium sp.]
MCNDVIENPNKTKYTLFLKIEYNKTGMEKIQISAVTPNDLNALKAISIQTFTETFAPVNSAANLATYITENLTDSLLQSELKNKQSAFFFAKANDQILGYLKLNWGTAQTENVLENAMEIQRIYVLQEFQGQQIGYRLLAEAIAIATAKKVASIWLGVWEHNHKALQFYKKNGFTAFNQHQFTLGNEVQTDLLLRYQLPK